MPAPTIGLATKLGVGVSTTAFAGAVAAYLTGDRSEQTLGTIVGGVVGALVLMTTMVGRYAQAHAQVKATAVPSATKGVTNWSTPATYASTSGCWTHAPAPQTVPLGAPVNPAHEVPGGSVPTGQESGVVK